MWAALCFFFYSPTALLDLCDLMSLWKAGRYYLQKAPSFVRVYAAEKESIGLELKHQFNN